MFKKMKKKEDKVKEMYDENMRKQVNECLEVFQKNGMLLEKALTDIHKLDLTIHQHEVKIKDLTDEIERIHSKLNSMKKEDS